MILPLTETHPALAGEWDRDKNELPPEAVSKGSEKRAWWRCPRGHSYDAPVYSRVAGCGCPYCAGKRPIPGETDLAATHPSLAAEWDRERNLLPPESVTAGSHKTVWWRCALGHSWRAAPYSRAAGAGCPVCAGRVVLPGFNDLATTHPHLCREWSPLNGALTPRELSKGSNRKVWWECAAGHVWRAAVYARTRERPSGCPICAAGRKKTRRADRFSVPLPLSPLTQKRAAAG